MKTHLMMVGGGIYCHVMYLPGSRPKLTNTLRSVTCLHCIRKLNRIPAGRRVPDHLRPAV